MVTPPHTPVPFSPVLEDAYVPTPDAIAEADPRDHREPCAGMSIDKLGMPKWGLSMTEGRLIEWLVDEGAEIGVGDEVAEVETEKINGVVESPAAGVLRRRVAAAGDVIPVGGLLGVIADASVADAEIDAFVAEFEASFVPGESEEDARSDAGGRGRHPLPAPGRGRRAARAPARLRRRPQQLALQRRVAVGRARGDRARLPGPRRLGQGGARPRGVAALVPRWTGHRACSPRRSLHGRPGRRRVRGCRARAGALLGPDRTRRARLRHLDRSTSTASSRRPRASSSSRCCSSCSPTRIWSRARWSTTCSSTSGSTACRRR